VGRIWGHPIGKVKVRGEVSKEGVKMNGFHRSFERAIDISGWDRDDDYCIIKVKPNFGCCCFHHWHEAWIEIGNIIKIPDFGDKKEGDILIKKNNEEFVLQCHETGPEFIFNIGCGLAATFLYDLIKIFLRKCIKDNREIEIFCVILNKNEVKIKKVFNKKDVVDINKEVRKICKQEITKMKNAKTKHR